MKIETYLAIDIDGTIFDSSEIVGESFKKGVDSFSILYGKNNIRIPENDEIISVLGMPVPFIFSTLFPDLNENDRLLLNDECTKALLQDIRDKKGKIFDGVIQTLTALYGLGYKILVASNGRSEYVKAILDTYNLLSFFSEPLIFPDNNLPDKTSIIKYYQNHVSLDNLLIMIGDRTSDLEAAEKNDIPFIGCTYGHAGDTEIKNCKWKVNTFSEILIAVLKIEENDIYQDLEIEL